jgi:hypothetical protein
MKNGNCIEQFMCLLHQLNAGSLVFPDCLGSFYEIHAAIKETQEWFTSTFFNKDHVVLTTASRKPALRLLARISRVFSVIVKHEVSVFSRT